MKKTLLLLASLATGLFLFSISLRNNSEASNYYQGIPSQLKNTSWHSHDDNSWSIYRFNKKSYSSSTMGMPGVKVTNVHYTVSRGYYKLVGHGIKNGGYKGGTEVAYFKVHGTKLTVHYPKFGYTIYYR